MTKTKFTPGQIGGAIGIGIATVAMSGRELPAMDWRDYCAFAALALILYWCFKPSRRDKLLDAEAHEGAGQGFAFRLGKTLKRIGGGRNR